MKLFCFVFGHFPDFREYKNIHKPSQKGKDHFGHDASFFGLRAWLPNLEFKENPFLAKTKKRKAGKK